MEQQQQPQKMIRRRKFLLVLPLLVLPFLTFLFWALGGGTGKEAAAAAAAALPAGLNPQLPEAHLKEAQGVTKMDFYNRAQREADQVQELINNDPHYTALAYEASKEDEDDEQNVTKKELSERNGKGSSIYRDSGNALTHERQVYRKLDQLNSELNRVATPSRDPSGQSDATSENGAALPSADVDRLEQMMEAMNQPDGEDEDIQQLNGVLEKILDIQHPDRVAEKVKQTSLKRTGQVFAVKVPEASLPVSSLAKPLQEKDQANGFYSLEDSSQVLQTQNSIQAVVHETQSLVNGATVKLRLLSDVFINGMLIPRNQFLFGTAALNGERLIVQIPSIRYQQSVFPVALSVFDMDGLAGIYIPGALSREVAKASAARSLQAVGQSTFDQTVEAQAATAGIEAAKNLFSRQVKLIKVTVKAGYRVLLKDEKQQ